MTNNNKYGMLQSENWAEENEICRRICKEISEFGINDRQRLFLIYLLSLELESQSQMSEISACIKDITDNAVFVSNIK